MRAALLRLVSFADDPADDQSQVRRRVGVAAGYLTIVAPLPLPLQASFSTISIVLALSLSAFSMINLVVLARTKRFERFVVALLIAGVMFVPLATWIGGGITGPTSGIAYAFLVPAYAIMALGPDRATRWFAVFVGMTIVIAIGDPIFSNSSSHPSYPQQVATAVANALIPLSIVFVLLRYTDVRRRVAEARVDELLTNAIPRPIAARLRRGESRIAEAYPETTIVFADIAGFTPWAGRTDPTTVVSLLDALFSHFDELAAEHGVEKIKTIGDSYMAVAGAPEVRADHAVAALAFARSMLAAEREWSTSNSLNLSLRVGVASGPVVGGVIGTRRILFDLWGDTVNVASRMESSGVPGRVQLAESTVDLLGETTGFERREVDVKGLGVVRTYLTG